LRCIEEEVAMRPVRIITAVVFAAAIAVTGCAAHSTAVNPSVTPVVDAPAPPVASPAPKPIPLPVPKPIPVPTPARAPKAPVLADGHYDAYIQQVNTRSDYLVVDLVQVFQGQTAIEAAFADGLPRDQAQVLYVWVRNQNPRLRTLAIAKDMRLDLLPGDCVESRSHQFAKLIKDSRAISNSRPAYYFTLTVAGGAVHHIQEDKTFNAC
jgi:hypothetical protein